ncbi:unnamed protein product [Coffea canephora]|uniref:DH200=94 genomic scaffold, scaffold_9179 n=1 Tax=Coffea canephora TaxID=49390 RepID=A0A068VN35_COFCA|nr:unnamed protein product [Coffea canephora]CDP22024.1 unnamed protein product [Coffea canephora]
MVKCALLHPSFSITDLFLSFLPYAYLDFSHGYEASKHILSCLCLIHISCSKKIVDLLHCYYINGYM